MRIMVKTAGLLGKYLPSDSSNNHAEIEVAAGATPRDVMVQLGMPLEASYLITHNGASVPTAERARRKLSENDVLAIMPPLKGG